MHRIRVAVDPQPGGRDWSGEAEWSQIWMEIVGPTERDHAASFWLLISLVSCTCSYLPLGNWDMKEETGLCMLITDGCFKGDVGWSIACCQSDVDMKKPTRSGLSSDLHWVHNSTIRPDRQRMSSQHLHTRISWSFCATQNGLDPIEQSCQIHCQRSAAPFWPTISSSSTWMGSEMGMARKRYRSMVFLHKKRLVIPLMLWTHPPYTSGLNIYLNIC